MTASPADNTRAIDCWFPCPEVDAACGNPAGSGRNEKAIFTWFASRPIAQARAAVACALLPDSEPTRADVRAAVDGDRQAIGRLAAAVGIRYPEGRPVVLDLFSGRGIIPLEAARLGTTAVGLDLSPVATLAGRLLADYPLRDWSAEPALPWPTEPSAEQLAVGDPDPRLISDLKILLAEVGSRVRAIMEPYYPRNADGTFPWGYLWATSIPCDGCNRRFPLITSLTLRHPYRRTNDPGQSLRLVIDGDVWTVEVADGVASQQPTYSSAEYADGRKRKGKNARCPFCAHVHSLEAVKAKGFANEYRDEVLAAADNTLNDKKIFRAPRPDERAAIARIDIGNVLPIGPFSAVPDELIPEGNVHTLMASGYGHSRFGTLMCVRQALQFVEIARAIRSCHHDILAAGCSSDYARALASYAASIFVRQMKRATRGATLLAHGRLDGSAQNRVQTDHIFANESKVGFSFDYFEAGIGDGPGTWVSIATTGVKPLATHIRGLDSQAKPARFRAANAMALPYRDGSVDAIITDPPYYDMIEYADASDLFFVWLRRILFDIEPDLFGVRAPVQAGLQNKDDEIIVRRVHEPGRARHDKQFYEASLARAFAEARRVLRADGHLVVVFGHSDPDAWKRLLTALHEAGFVVTSSWPSRTETANTGVASIKVTVTIGCRLAHRLRPSALAAEVDREVTEVIRERVRAWSKEGLALADQMMAAYGPAMEVCGRYSTILLPDGSPAPIERYLTMARRAVREATALRLDSIPLETFDALTRIAVFWLRLYGRTNVPKGEARFLAQADNLKIEDLRDSLLAESTAGFRLLVDPPARIGPGSATFDVARGLAGAYEAGGTDAAAEVLARSERASDDEQLWAVIGEIVAQLPASDTTARALVAIQRNGSAIKNLAKGLATARDESQATPQMNFDFGEMAQ